MDDAKPTSELAQPAATAEPAAPPAPDAPVEGRGIDGTPSRWLALAFVGFLSALVLLGTTGIGAAASTLLGGQQIDCGGP